VRVERVKTYKANAMRFFDFGARAISQEGAKVLQREAWKQNE
jgi:hypothetical protein